jgi:hypothetical protein
MIADLNFSITSGDMIDIITDSSRFMFHILLVHVVTHIIDGEDELFGMKTVKSLFVTAMSILIYYVLFKKMVDAKLNNIKSKNDKDNDNNI